MSSGETSLPEEAASALPSCLHKLPLPTAPLHGGFLCCSAWGILSGAQGRPTVLGSGAPGVIPSSKGWECGTNTPIPQLSITAQRPVLHSHLLSDWASSIRSSNLYGLSSFPVLLLQLFIIAFIENYLSNKPPGPGNDTVLLFLVLGRLKQEDHLIQEFSDRLGNILRPLSKI